MNSEPLKEFRQAAYDLLVTAKDATSLVNGCSDDHQKCSMFSRICIESVIYSSVGEYLSKHDKTVDQFASFWGGCWYRFAKQSRLGLQPNLPNPGENLLGGLKETHVLSHRVIQLLKNGLLDLKSLQK
jgi:hypothetical protein